MLFTAFLMRYFENIAMDMMKMMLSKGMPWGFNN